MAATCSSPSPRNWANSPTNSPSKATPIPSPTPPPPTATGHFPPTAPTRRAASCRPMEWAPTRSLMSAACRLMKANVERPDQVTQVRGFADQRLRKPDAPLAPSTRRISLIVQYIVKNNNDDDDAKIG